MNHLSIDAIMTSGPVIPVLAINQLDHAVPLAKALVAGGLRVLEITLRTDCALAAITCIRQAVPDAIVGAGTIRTASHVTRAADAGAQFAVSPGFTPDLAKAAMSQTIPLLPGVATASEIMNAHDHGFTHLKFFPAEASGGVTALQSFKGPFPDIRFCPTGGITLQNARAYLALPNVLCVGGSWVAPRSLVEKSDWKGIEALAAATLGIGG